MESDIATMLVRAKFDEANIARSRPREGNITINAYQDRIFPGVWTWWPEKNRSTRTHGYFGPRSWSAGARRLPRA